MRRSLVGSGLIRGLRLCMMFKDVICNAHHFLWVSSKNDSKF